ncbi:MAG: DEAD/DEAH box helicase [Planctomycetota bacterium]
MVARRPEWTHAGGLEALRALRARPAAHEQWTRLDAEDRVLLFVLDLGDPACGGVPRVEVRQRQRRKDGSPGVAKPLRVTEELIEQLPNAEDRRILTALLGAEPPSGRTGGGRTANAQFIVPEHLAVELVAAMCQTGRLHLVSPGGAEPAPEPLRWDAGEPWQLVLAVGAEVARGTASVRGSLRRGRESLDVGDVDSLQLDGVMLRRGVFARADYRGARPAAALLGAAPVTVPLDRLDELVEAVLQLPGHAELELPLDWQHHRTPIPPTPCLRIDTATETGEVTDTVTARLDFNYLGARVEAAEPGAAVRIPGRERVVARDLEFERAASRRLLELGGEPQGAPPASAEPPRLALARATVADVARQLLDEGWFVAIDDRALRRAETPRLEVGAKPDWLELRAAVRFGDQAVPMPDLLRALRRGRRWLRLADGTLGLLSGEWLDRMDALLQLGAEHGDHVRLRRSQASLVDALLLAQPDVGVDRDFEAIRVRLRGFDGIAPEDPPSGFCGSLRHYQRQALGWFRFVRELGFGGCLADDMGLGKTVQILALLAGRQGAGPSLVVVPSSLLFNWSDEAARFAPGLRLAEYSGPGRAALRPRLATCDVILTTYGVLRADIDVLAPMELDYAVLDEAHVIKNGASQVAKCARLLRARHRLAVTGTPIENGLKDLWSLFEFANPGMLGAAPLSVSGGREPDEVRDAIAIAVRPFFLRRTKEQVVRDLPPKTEQELRCVMGEEQRQIYLQLRDYYRDAVARERDAGQTSCALMLEGLLRLRQAACHPGLLDPARGAAAPSAKLDVLLPRLEELVAEGHKAVVFSQFTGLLDLVAARLSDLGIPYEALDGRTKDRRAPVERFLRGAGGAVFLVSLKAGGVGLNLTAADYVFLLDPWWNPAAEAQAIDRCHRIGQQRPVFATRLICADTVEEKVLALQQDKREVAAAVIPRDDGVLRHLSQAELVMLLGEG